MMLEHAPLKQRYHKYIDNSIDQWLDIHFGDTSFNGRAVIGHRKPGKEGIHTLSMRPLTELKPYIKMVHASPRLDYYITANTVHGLKRLKDELFGLQNIVIDIDCHDKEIQPHAIAPLVQAFIWRSKRDLWNEGIIPPPNSIVRTGRGVQLWWAIVPCYGGRNYDKSLYHYDKIKNNFMNHIEDMLNTYSDELEGLSVDRGASSNPVGYFRLPCTYNTKSGSYGTLEILHSERYDQRVLTRLKAPEAEEKKVSKNATSTYIPMLQTDREVLKGYQTTGVRRVMQLIKLRNLRNNNAGSEMRDCFNFSVYNALRMTFDHNEAMVRVRKFNEGFKRPMRKRELENCVSTAKAKEGYRYTNAKLIELLEITPEEQEAIGILPSSERQAPTPNASRDAARKALKEDRDYKILELAEKGVSQAETARILGIGKNTVGRVLKRMREENTKEHEENTKKHEIDDKENRHQNGSIYVLCEYRDGINSTSKYSSPYPAPDDEENWWAGGLLGMPRSDSS